MIHFQVRPIQGRPNDETILRSLAILWLATAALPAHGQTALDLFGAKTEKSTDDSAIQQATNQDLQELLRLLSNPALVAQLTQRSAETAGQQPGDGSAVAKARQQFQNLLSRIGSRARAIALALTTVPQLYGELTTAWTESMAGSEFLRSAIHMIIFLFGGFGLEWLYWSYLSALLKRVEHSKPDTYGGVLRAAMIRATLLLGSIAVFGFGSIGLFVAFEWSAFVEHIVFALLAGIIAIRFIVMAAVFVLAPRVNELRLLPLDEAAAGNIYRWILTVSGVGLLGILCVDTLDRLAIAAPSLLAVETVAGSLFVTVLIIAMWYSDSVRRREISTAGAGIEAALETEADAEVVARLPTPGNFRLVLSSAIVLVAFWLWLVDFQVMLWTLVTGALLLPAIKLSRIMVDHIFDCVERESPEAASEDEDEKGEKEVEKQVSEQRNRYTLYRPIADRLIRFLLVIVAVLTIGLVWDVTSMLESASNSFAQKVFGVVIDIVFALLIADLVWTWAKTAIEQKLASFPAVVPGHSPGPEARMATLLPMFEKVLMVTIIIMVALIIISSLGVNIGPILAGAGVVGIALGFGAQALVKDIFSGVFFLIDDAFRVGEYIEMGELRGTVESVSIRSLRVRHHRGALHTIPYGELNSLTNYSRDWVIMKLQFRVPFDTDLKLAKKLVKQVGARLQENPDYGHHLIEPLKFQGVRRMEEFNMVVGVKFTAVPGEQWTIRRDAYQQILDEFESNGIKFAARNVQVEVVSDRQLTKEEEEAAVGAAQEIIEQQLP